MIRERIDSVELCATASGERFVVLRTDTGRTGAGELGFEAGIALSAPSADALATVLVGRDPVNVNQFLSDAAGAGHAGIADPNTLAAATAAMLDLTGRRLNVPLCRLLGGPVRDQIPVCAVDWAVGLREADDVVDAARRTISAGFTTLRVDVDDLESVSARVARVAALRAELPTDIGLVVQGASDDATFDALELIQELRRLGVQWFEQPIAAPRSATLHRLADRSPVALTAGRGIGPSQLATVAAAGIVDYLVVEPGAVGGLHAARQLAALAEIHHIHVIVSGSGGPNSLGVALQLAAVIPNLAMVEVVPGQLNAVDGVVPMDPSPGLPHPSELYEFTTNPTHGGVVA